MQYFADSRDKIEDRIGTDAGKHSRLGLLPAIQFCICTSKIKRWHNKEGQLKDYHKILQLYRQLDTQEERGDNEGVRTIFITKNIFKKWKQVSAGQTLDPEAFLEPET